MNTIDKLKAVRALIENPENWTKGAYAEERDGHKCYCLIGAIGNASPNQPRLSLHAALRKQLPERFKHTGKLVQFNDHPDTTHADVLALIDRAIAAEAAQVAVNRVSVSA